MFTWTEKLNARDRFCLALWGKYIWISVRPVTHNESKLYTFYISSSDNTGLGHAPCRPRIRELQSAINGQHRECRIYLHVSHNHLYQEERRVNHECCLAGGGCGCGYSCGGYYHDEQGKMSPCYYSIIPSSPSISSITSCRYYLFPSSIYSTGKIVPFPSPPRVICGYSVHDFL